MKRCGCFHFTLVILLCFASLNIYGQKTEISKEEYDKAVQSAERSTKSFSYRIKGKSKILRESGKKPSELRRWIYEFQFPYGRHSVWETKKAGQDKFEIFETIEAGNFQYTRVNKGEWQAKRIRGGYNNLPISSLWEFNNEEFYLTKNVKFNNRKVNLYEYVSKTKVSRLRIEGAPPPKPIDVIHTERRWISADGLVLKIEIISNSHPLNLENSLIHEVSVYEYDPKIKIKAPIPEPKNDFTVY